MLSNILELELHSTKHAHTQNEEVQFNDGGSSYIRTAFDLCGHAPNSVLWGGMLLWNYPKRKLCIF